ILVKGAVPGSEGGWVLVRDAVKRALPEGVPFPAGVKESAAPAAEEATAEEGATEATPTEATLADEGEAKKDD
ncbi:MAG: hypothetical protein MI785_18975, partial [Kiloniellales bacterium]|nr:hypothetical protein [Kiloniellales bacterium]